MDLFEQAISPKKPSGFISPSGTTFLVLITFLFILITSSKSVAQISFENTTNTAGPFHKGESWGASWGDINSDGRPDLFVSNHRTQTAMYQNMGDGTFSDITEQTDRSKLWLKNPTRDIHGGAWADFDNDGDQDLFLTTGSCCNGQLFKNVDGALFDETQAYGIPDDKEGRFPVWWDLDNDGQLDLTLMINSSSIFLKQNAGKFTDITKNAGATCTLNTYAQLADLNNDGNLDFICERNGSFPDKAYTSTSTPFQNITSLFQDTVGFGLDAAVADFDGNLEVDFVIVRGKLRPNHASIITDRRIEAWLDSGPDSTPVEQGFSFQGNDVITITVHSAQINDPGFIFIGSNGVHPNSTKFSLDPNNPKTWDRPIHSSAAENRIYVWFDKTSQRWQIDLSPRAESTRAYVSVQSKTTTISDLTMTEPGIGDNPIAPVLLSNTGGKFKDITDGSGLDIPLTCVSIAAGDFDNDMDIDLYFVCRRGIENKANILFENQGDGSFTKVADAGEAKGLVGRGLNRGAGTGESVAVADYDTDGFLDLFVTNGLLMQPMGTGGADQLFHNRGNRNHWIELDLEGVTSNRDGIGAKVFATTGNKTQLRESNGGYHRWSQDHRRLHFGLGDNTQVDLRITWPSGVIDQFGGIQADKLYRVKEGDEITEISSGEGGLGGSTSTKRGGGSLGFIELLLLVLTLWWIKKTYIISQATYKR